MQNQQTNESSTEIHLEPPQPLPEGSFPPTRAALPSFLYTTPDHAHEPPDEQPHGDTSTVPAPPTEEGSSVCRDLGDTYSTAEYQRPHRSAPSTQSTALEALSAEEREHLVTGILPDRPPLTLPPPTHPPRTRKGLANSISLAMVETSPTRKGDAKKYYLPWGKLLELIREPTVEEVLRGEGMTEAKALARAICVPSIVPSGGGKKGQNQRSTRRKIFATLVLISKVGAISRFVEDGVLDTHLPLLKDRDSKSSTTFLTREASPATRLNCGEDWTDNETDLFYMKQWHFLSPFFANQQGKIMHYPLQYDIVLPLRYLAQDKAEAGKELAANGGFSIVSKVEFHPDHHNFGSENERKNLALALKRLLSPDKAEFDREVEALKKLSHCGDPHMIRLLWTYHWREHYYLVFPWADGNLWEFCEKYPNGPELTSDRTREVWMIWLAKQFHGIAAALSRIHVVETHHPQANNPDPSIAPKATKHLAPTGDQEYGRHGDLKPDNILWFAPRDSEDSKEIGVLKVSDFNLSDFHRHGSRSGLDARGIRWSSTYHAPECLISMKLARSYDIWTLGCVYIEFVSWFLLGSFAARHEFSNRRVEDDILRGVRIPGDEFFTIQAASDVRAVVKKSVLDWVDRLRDNEGCSPFLDDLLSYILSAMLVASADKREECPKVAAQLEQMLRRCETDSEYCLGPKKSPAPSRSATLSSGIVYTGDEGQQILENFAAMKGRTQSPAPAHSSQEPRPSKSYVIRRGSTDDSDFLSDARKVPSNHPEHRSAIIQDTPMPQDAEPGLRVEPDGEQRDGSDSSSRDTPNGLRAVGAGRSSGSERDEEEVMPGEEGWFAKLKSCCGCCWCFR